MLRPSRRRLLRSAGLGGAAIAATAVGCAGTKKPAAGSSRASAPGQASTRPSRGGTLVYAGGLGGSYDIQGRTFDPYIQTQQSSKSYGLFYSRLVAYDLATYAIEPDLAQKWEQPSHTEYLLHLQPGIKWQNKPPVNGRALTVDDIIWSLERARTNDPKFFTKSFLSLVDKIEAPDKATVRITTKEPDASTLTKLAIDNMAILSRQVFETYPKPTTADAAVGTGAFIMKSEEENVGADYVRNPDYWKPDQPYLDGLRTKAFSDTLTAYAAFRADQVDICLLPGSDVKAYLAQQGSGYQPNWFADDTMPFMYPNVQRKPMDDPRVTSALRLLVDHDEFITAWAEVAYGRGGYGSIFPTAMGKWDLTEAEYRQHLEWKQPKDEAVKEAVTRLNAAGYTKDSPLRFMLDCSANQPLSTQAELLQAQWKRLSQGVVDIQLKLDAAAAVDSVRTSRSFTYATLGISAGMADPDVWFSAAYRTGASQNFMGLSDPKLDAMIDKQRAIFDEGQRKAAVKEIVLYMIDNCPSALPVNRYFLQAVKSKVRDHRPEYFLNGSQYQSVSLTA
ncbi:MAG TPA: ABC transporter substrate-binding protein, partial [Dehalococcoidia bacterium]|nr:ABC transporter substrate-binding protein [Dehalococcoidia bacterium]